MFRTRLIGILLLLITVSVMSGCNNTEEATAEKREVPIEVQPVSYGSLSDTNRLTGTIIPEQEVSVMPKAAAEIKEVLVEKGDTVSSGDVIARLDSTTEQNTLSQQQSSLQQAQSSLRSAITGKEKAQRSYEQAKASLRQAKASLADARKSQKDNIDNLEFDIENAKLAWDQAKKNLERMKTLHDDGLISEKEYEDAVKAEKDAKRAYDRVKLNKAQATSDVSLKSLEASVDQAAIGVDLANSSIEEAEIGVEQAQAQVDQAQLSVDSAKEQLQNKVIVAPAAGELTSLAGEEGEMASGQNVFATIVSLDKVKVEVKVMADQLETFKKGDSVEIEVAGREKNVTGTISYIAATSSGSGLFTVEAEINNSQHTLRPGMVASLVVDEVLAADSILVPTDAIVQVQGKSIVFVVAEGKAVRKEVEVVRYGTDSTAVTGDLAKDQQVVTSGQNLLEDGVSVKIMEED